MAFFDMDISNFVTKILKFDLMFSKIPKKISRKLAGRYESTTICVVPTCLLEHECLGNSNLIAKRTKNTTVSNIREISAV